ncbi:hypothetical protein PF008_g13118 [Phytophthora fragariae]|uniref:DEK-C domain-containing protein n=1 Tax=Phytophthora fragariae TaxID=53985 RepID=A0A6G0RMB9_9STRA|nr:hypothetical protein PF008_g13118 [Phytophthora fragariae]
MMEALGDDPTVSVESLVTEDSIVKALREILPSMDADTATLKVVMQKLAARFGMNFADLKAQWRPSIKTLLPDLLELCAGGDASEADDSKDEPEAKEDEEEEEEEEVDLRPSRRSTQRTTKKRNAVVDASDEEDDANESDASEGEAKPEEDDDDEDEDTAASVKKRWTSDNGRAKKRKNKEVAAPAKKPKTSKQPDPPGLASLKELGRAAGVLNPRLYRLLKDSSSTEEAEEILRKRLHDAGIAFNGSYPTSRDINAAKRKLSKDKDLEGIDTTLIITGGRSRRGTSQPRISYKEERISGEEDNADDDDDDDEEDEDAEEDEDEAPESAASDSGESEASF